MAEAADETWLAEHLVSTGKLTRAQLAAALATQLQQGGPGRVRLAEVLVRQGLASAAELEETQLDGAPAGASPAPVTLAGRFEVRAELGRGGMGAVYRAYDPQLNREVAIKLIYGDGSHGSAQTLARFQREAQVLARLRHTAIVSIHEVGTHEGQPFIVMDLVEGTSLQELLERDPPPTTRELVEMISQVADALDHAHGQGVVHRDVKPANVMVDQVGCPQLMDFGIARDLAASEALTATGEVVGTPTYLAPEQAGSSGLKAGPYTDVYALGAVLYRGVTGRPPFVADSTVAIIMKVLREDPVPLRRLDATVSADLETITLKCLEKDPSRRYGSAAALADDLRRFLAGEPILARPRGLAQRAACWLSGNSGVVAASGLGVVAVVTFGVALREPDSGGTTGRTRFEPQGVREAPSAEDPAHAAEIAVQRDAATKTGELEPESFFVRLRERGRMRNIMGVPEANNDLVWSVKIPAEMVEEDLSALTALPRLGKVSLRGVPFSDTGMAFLRPLTQLKEVDLQGTRVTDAGLEHLEGMAGLFDLDLDHTRVTSAGLQHLSGLRSLVKLQLSGNQEVGDAGLVHLLGLKGLRLLRVSHTKVSDSGLVHLARLKSLTTLDLMNTRVSDSGLAHLQGLRSLRDLSLSQTQVTDAGLEQLQGLKQLKKLRMADCPVTDAGVAAFKAALPRCEVRR